MTNTALPCPFCGGSPELTDYYGNYNKASWCVHCKSCDLSLDGDNTPEEAIKRWNTRSPAIGTPDDAREALIRRIELARSFIAKEYADPAQELHGDWISPEAKPAHDALCLCLQALAAIPREQDVKPVAWRSRHGANPWRLHEDKPTGPSAHLFIIEPLFAAPPSDSPGSAHQPQGGDAREGGDLYTYIPDIVKNAMLTMWNYICDDSKHHPLDIEHGKGKFLTFEPKHWAQFTGEMAQRNIRDLFATPPAPVQAAAEPGKMEDKSQ